MAVEFAEMPDSPLEEWGEESFRATCKYIVAWGERNTFAGELSGKYYPRWPNTLALPRTTSIVPFPAQILAAPDAPTETPIGSTYAVYEKALVTVVYDSSLTSAQGGGGDETAAEWVTESLEPTAEFITLPNKKLYWTATGEQKADQLDPTQAPGKLIPGLAYKVSLAGCRYIPGSIFSLLGCVNAYPTRSYTLGIVFPAETLLYTATGADRRITTKGTEGWTLHFTFNYRPWSWNLGFNPLTQAFAPMYSSGGGIFRPYTRANFGTII